MSYQLRSILCNKIVKILDGFPLRGGNLKPADLLPIVLLSSRPGPQVEYNVDVNNLKELVEKNKSLATGAFDSSSFVKEADVDSSILGVYHNEDRNVINFKVNVCKAFNQTLNHVCQNPKLFWRSSALLKLIPSQKVVVEFSSPNIAKPFHVGHLRSTVQGNFLASFHKSLGHSVTKINYLGDWGTQFGLLQYMYNKKNLKPDDLQPDPIKKLYELYVQANKEATEDSDVALKSRELFNAMEKGEDESVLREWRIFKDLSIEDFKRTYSKLGVTFDEFHGESMYGKEKCEEIINIMKTKGILQTHDDGRLLYDADGNNSKTIVKSDGSTLYITRDIAAAIDRYKKYNFDRMYYVVDNTQVDHFRPLFSILRDMGFDWVSKLHHIAFGRIIGMSTRKGSAIFLSDLLGEAREIQIQMQIKSKTTKVESSESLSAADRVATSAIIVQDLRGRRNKDYKFDWQKALQNKGDTGVRLQYTHCRLVSLDENCGISLNSYSDEDFLPEQEAIDVIRQIAQFDQVVYRTYNELQASILVLYMIQLCKKTSIALVKLKVKGEPIEIAQSRLRMFTAVRHVLAAGMKMIGIEPIEKM